jgi:hypothetical protein
MAQNIRVARWPEGSRAEVRRYALASGSTFEAGALVVLDASEEIAECGADPASIMGIANANAADVVEAGFIEVTVATANTVFAATGWDGTAQDTPAKTDLNQSYGVVKDGAASRGWEVDTSDAVNTKVKVVDYDTDRKEFLFKFTSGALQG